MKLHDYQEVARDYLRERARAALFLDMGLGKTAAALHALEPAALPAFVVAPKRVAEETWPEQTELWRPDLRCEVAMGTPDQRDRVLRHSTADIVVIGINNIMDPGVLARPRPTVILDELSQFKTWGTERWKQARRLTLPKRASRVWGLTGTPAPNGLLDLWAQMYLLDRGQRLGSTLGGYRERYFRVARRMPVTGIVTEWELVVPAEQIHRLLEDLCLSMSTEGRVHLPPTTHNTVTVKMPPKVRNAYRRLKEDRVAGVELLGHEIITPLGAAALGAKLGQLASGFTYVQDTDGKVWDHHHDEKVKAVREIVDGTGSPVMVFYNWTAEREMLQKALPEARLVKEPGIFKDWNAGRVPVLLAHPASIGHGLNLQHGGHTIVWMSPTWDLEKWEQANKRLARQGQKNPVIIHRIVMEGSVEPRVYDALEGKTSVQKALLDHLESPL